MADRPFAEYAARNAAPILDVLQYEFADPGHILEVGSGTGQHAVFLGARLPHLVWQTSDLPENHSAITGWICEAALDNVLPPIDLDVRTASAGRTIYDGVFSANTAHIMGIDAVASMFALLGKLLRPGGIFCLYGPFRRGGVFNTQSNADFDVSLRARDPEMGIRDLELLDEFGSLNGLVRKRLYAMPSNNHIAIWRRSEERNK